jgi:hypothetical protein
LKTKLTIACAVAACATLIGYGGASAAGPNTTVVVDPSNFTTVFPPPQTSIATSSEQFVTGPATPPLGVGSFELTTTDTTGHQQYLEYSQLNTLLSAIDEMAYSTYRHSASTGTPTTVAAINLAIFSNATGPNTGFNTLVFEPYLNPAEGPVLSDTWQTWDAYNGGAGVWHATHTAGTIAAGVAEPWSAFLAQLPAATVIGFGPNQGSNNPGIISDVDAMSIGTAAAETTYNFEPAPENSVPEAPMAALLLGAGLAAGAVAVLTRRRRRSTGPAA